MNDKCTFCGSQVDPLARTTWHRVIGWERIAGIRASGKQGGSDIALREARDEYACSACIGLLKDGIPIGQASLL